MLIGLLAGAGALVGLAVMGSLLNVGAALSRVHGSLEVIYWILLAGLIGWLVVRPILQVVGHRLDSLKDFNEDETPPARIRQERLARRLLRGGGCSPAQVRELEYRLTFQKDLLPTLRLLIEERSQAVDRLVFQRSRQAFLAVTISQNGPLDVLMLLMLNLALIRDVVHTMGVRPSLPDLARLYLGVMVGALVIDQVDRLALEEALPAFGAFFAKSLVQGVGAAFVTLRVGYLAKGYLLAGGRGAIREEKPRARREARRRLRQVLVSSIQDLPGSIARIVEKILLRKERPVTVP